MQKIELTFNVTNLDLILTYFPAILLAGKSTASAEEIEAKAKELKKNLEELTENRVERQKVNEENSYLGDIDSPKEAESAQELMDWDSLIRETQETIVDIINWTAN
jgi:hypothetical protein